MTTKSRGLRVVDVRESVSSPTRFAQEQFGPFSKQAGITTQPALRSFDLSSILIAASTWP